MHIPELYKLAKGYDWASHPERRAEYSAKLHQACLALSESALALVPGIQLLLRNESGAQNDLRFSPDRIQYAIEASGTFNSSIDTLDPDDDLFDLYEVLPSAVKAVLSEFADEFMEADEIISAEMLEALLSRLEPFGLTFDYGLSMEPINLRVIREEDRRPSAGSAPSM